MANEDFKDLAERTASDKVLGDKAFNIAKNSKYDGYQRGLASMVYKFFDKKTAGSANIDANESAFNNEKLHKLENFKKEWFVKDLKITFGVLI